MSRYFPLFIDLEGKRVCVFGAGTIASRRIRALLDFGCDLTVIAPDASTEVQRWSEEGQLLWKKVFYQPGMVQGAFLVLAATDEPEVNAQIRKECKVFGIPVNVSSDRELCDFYFPGLAVEGELVAGVTAGGGNHGLAREAAGRIREVLKELADAEL